MSRGGMLGRMVFRSLTHGGWTTVLALLTLTTCGALAVMFATVYIDITAKMTGVLRELGANAVAYSAEASGRKEKGAAPEHPLRWAVVERVARQFGASVTVVSLEAAEIEGTPVAVAAVDMASLARMTPYWSVSGRRVADAGECLVGRRLATVLRLGEGSQPTLEWPRTRQRSTLKVTGVFESGDEDEDRVFVPAQPWPEGVDARSPLLSYALLSVPGGQQGLDRLAVKMTEAGAPVSVKPLRQFVRGERVVLAKVTALSLLSLATVLALSALGVTAAVLARTVERRRELALLQALGASRRTVLSFLLSESLLLSGAASVAAFILGTLLAQVTSERIFGVSVAPRPVAFVAGLAVSLLVALVAGFAGARRALRLQAATALRGE